MDLHVFVVLTISLTSVKLLEKVRKEGGGEGYFGFFVQDDLGRWNDPMIPKWSSYF